MGINSPSAALCKLDHILSAVDDEQTHSQTALHHKQLKVPSAV